MFGYIGQGVGGEWNGREEMLTPGVGKGFLVTGELNISQQM
jgi:hypothetical protein